MIQNENLGYTKKLCILPFDHRSYFENLLGFTEPLSDDQKKELTEYKKIVYAGYEKSLSIGVDKEMSAILVDDVFGLDILIDAKNKEYTTLQSTEISGVDHFEFEHGDSWQEWVEKVQPSFVKVLVRYNVDRDGDLNQKSLINLKKVSDYAHTHGYKFLIEPLVGATPNQLEQCGGDKTKYDHELRPDLTVRMIIKMQNAGVEPDVWKIEGMYSESDYQKCVTVAQQNNRINVGIVSLGRNETDEIVELWLRTGSKVPGVIGFAVGRTIFLEALLDYRKNTITADQASTKIAERFLHFYNVFNNN